VNAAAPATAGPSLRQVAQQQRLKLAKEVAVARAEEPLGRKQRFFARRAPGVEALDLSKEFAEALI
jgi:hypothetical protein